MLPMHRFQRLRWISCFVVLNIASAVQDIWLLSIQPFTGADWDAGISMRIGAQIMLEEINNHPTLLQGYNLKVVWQDGLCAKTHGTNLFLQNIFDKTYQVFAPGAALGNLDADNSGTITTSDVAAFQQVWNSTLVSPDPIGLLGSGCSGTAINIVNVAYKARLPMISNSATRPSLSSRTAFPNFFRTILPDTFFNDAWVAFAKQLNQTSLVNVIGETQNWASMGARMVEVSQAQGMTLVGNDLSGEMPGFKGLQISIDSKSAATDVATELVRLKQRVVILQMFAPRNRLVLCEAYKKEFFNGVYFVMGWLAFGWWSATDTDCTPAQLTSMASWFISANMMHFRFDLSTKLDCAHNMTGQQWLNEWYARQGKSVGDLSKSSDGYELAKEASTTADAVCMYAQMLHDILNVRSSASLTDLSSRTEAAYSEVQTVLRATDFEGVQGRVRFAPNSPDPQGGIIIQQFHPTPSQTLGDVGSYLDGAFNYFGQTRVKFQFSGEDYAAGPLGATSIVAPLTPFKTCPPGKSVKFEDNSCIDCAKGTVFVPAAGVCVCDKGSAPSEAVGGAQCGLCSKGKYAEAPGQLTCDVCPTGKFSNVTGMTKCSWCEVGTYSDTAGSSKCPPAVRNIWLTAIQPFTGADWDAGLSMRFGGQIMLEEVNKHDTLLKGFDLKVAWQDGLCAKTHGTDLFLTNIFDKRYDIFAPGINTSGWDRDKSGVITTSDTKPLNQWWDSTQVFPDPVGLLGSGCSGTAINIVGIAYKARFPLVSNSASRPALSDRSKFPNFFRTILPDTKFPEAWMAICKMMNQKSVVAVIAETGNWGSMGTITGQNAKRFGIELVGFDKTSEIPEFTGLQMSMESQSAAKDVATELVRLKQRVVILMMFAQRNRLVLCEAFKQNFRNAIYMPMGWLPAGWWAAGADTDCRPEDLTSMVQYYISANMMMFRADADTVLSCSNNMTMDAFRTEWFKRQGAEVGDLSMRPEGYALATEGALTADAVCMWAKALHETLIAKKIPLEYHSARTAEAYSAIQEALTDVDFEGVQGRVSYGPGQADPQAGVILQQLQPVSGGGRRLAVGTQLVDIASSLNGNLSFFGHRLKFHFSGEDFDTVKGATSISVTLTSYKTCSDTEKLDMLENTCKACPTGQVYLQVASVCACDTGSVYNATSSNCSTCPAGKFAGNPGQNQCDSCPSGTYATSTGATGCLSCSLGYYQSLNGTTFCEKCLPGETTIMTGLTSNEGCNCEPGRYRPVNTTNVMKPCIPCLEGMVCAFGSESTNFKVNGGDGVLIPMLKAGYYSEASTPLVIYECIDEKACPGGVPASCAATRSGLVCALCPDGYSKNTKTGECDECSGGITAVVVLTPLFMIFCIIMTYYIGNSPLSANASITLTCSTACGLVITVFQVMAVYKQLSIPWPKPVLDLLSVASFFNLDADAVSIECALGHDAIVLYLMRILIPVMFVALVFVMYLVTKVIALLSGLQSWCIDKVLNCTGQVLQMLFIAFAVIVIRPLECESHPSGNSSVYLFPEVLCWSDDHAPLLGLAIFETLFFLGPFAALCVWANFNAPRLSSLPQPDGKPNRFLVQFRFLLYRFRPDLWWWGNVFLLRQTLLAFSSSLPGSDPHGQIIYTASILAAYLGFMCRRWPWKNHSLNMLDSGSTLLMLLVITSAAAFLPTSPEIDNHVTFLMVMIGLLAVVILAFTFAALKSFLRDGISGDFEAGQVGSLTPEELCARWLKSSELFAQLGAATCEPMVCSMNRYDREVLFNSLLIWESTSTDFLPASEVNQFFQEPGKKTNNTRLVHMKNSTVLVERAVISDHMTQTLSRLDVDSDRSRKSGQDAHQEQKIPMPRSWQDALPIDLHEANPPGEAPSTREEKMTTEVVTSIGTVFMVDQNCWEHNQGPYTPRLMPVSRPHTPRSASPPHTPR